MIEDILQAIKVGKDQRQNIAQLKIQIKEKNLTDSYFEQSDLTMFMELLKSDDAKIRKNAALLLGELQVQEALPSLLNAYEQEQQLFVLSSYVTAMGKLDCRSVLLPLKEKYHALLKESFAEDEKKHRNAEMHALSELLLSYEEHKRHKFKELDKQYRLLLVMEPVFAELTQFQIKNVQSKVSPFGLWVLTDEIRQILEIRTYREILFELPIKQQGLKTSDEIAKAVMQTGLPDFLYGVHEGTGAFTFRVDVKGKMDLDKKSVLARKTAEAMEELSNHRLINSTSNYEFEVRLLQKKDETFYPFIKLYTIPQKRFSYRKNAISTSLNPAKAAAIVATVKPYLREKSQIIDPFCGVGTLLIERAMYMETSDMYGVDSYGDAILKARENTALANLDINYINRDYFAFTHEYLFDEIITEMPLRGRKTKEEMDQFYASFFKKSKEILKQSGVMIVYSNEMNLIKKQMRIQSELQLKKEICVQEKDGYYIFIIGFKG